MIIKLKFLNELDFFVYKRKTTWYLVNVENIITLSTK